MTFIPNVNIQAADSGSVDAFHSRSFRVNPSLIQPPFIPSHKCNGFSGGPMINRSKEISICQIIMKPMSLEQNGLVLIK
jgi:hypothetical protein